MAAPNRTSEEAEIRRLIDGFQRAIRAKDLGGVLSVYAPDIVSFDLVPPMQHVGIAAYRRPWEETFASFAGPIGYQVTDLHVTATDEVAFSHSLNRMSGATKNGQTISLWVRWTACFRKLDGRWLVTHEQVSVPIDLASGRALLDLEPT
jgi:uncharacterized protein (TIGR02246 family)